jgi:protoporphyrinogen oxidase
MTKPFDSGPKDCIVIGGGYTGLSAAYELAKAGHKVAVYESDSDVGGLAGSFVVNGADLEKFYHHWFTSDRDIAGLIEELGETDRIVYRATNTGMYYANKTFRLSTPLDVLRFTPLPFFDRLRMAKVAVVARLIKDWRSLEKITAEAWLRKICGNRVYDAVWGPLLNAKFGSYANQIAAVWMWNKFKLRAGSRGKGGGENLAYYRGGFAELSRRLAQRIEELGGEVHTSTPVQEVLVRDKRVVGVRTSRGDVETGMVIATPALPIIDRMAGQHLTQPERDRLLGIEYLSNVCLVLQLDRSLSETYWLNVGDPSFPYVGIIEHTNFEPPESYSGRRIVYLSKYLPESAELYRMSDPEVLEFSLMHLKRMFPAFDRSWVIDYSVWRARYSQPIITLNYSEKIPATRTSVEGFFIETMAQVYPEDRGTNYAVRNGRRIGRELAAELSQTVAATTPIPS